MKIPTSFPAGSLTRAQPIRRSVIPLTTWSTVVPGATAYTSRSRRRSTRSPRRFFANVVVAIASVVVFPKLVFPFTDALTGTLYSFAIFSLAFVARPLGTVIFTAIDRSYGRGMKLGVALLLLGTSTVAIAFLPGYEEIGMASAFWLALFRVGQGLALGGSWDGLASLLAVNAPPTRRGYYAMIPELGAPLGAMVASALFAYIIANLAVLGAAIGVKLFDSAWPDVLVGSAIAMLFLSSAFSVLRESLSELQTLKSHSATSA